MDSLGAPASLLRHRILHKCHAKKGLLSDFVLRKFCLFYIFFIPPPSPTLLQALKAFDFVFFFFLMENSKHGCVSNKSRCFGGEFWTVPPDSK